MNVTRLIRLIFVKPGEIWIREKIFGTGLNRNEWLGCEDNMRWVLTLWVREVFGLVIYG